MERATSPKRVSGLTLTVFFSVLSLCALITVLVERGRLTQQREQMKYIASTVSAQTYEVLSAQLGKTKTLEAFVIQNQGGTEGFETVAALLIDDECVRNVLLAPKGVITDVYPLEGNETAIGHDLTGEDAGDKEAQDAIRRGELIMAGPFQLIQGGMGIAGRQPVYINGVFWGIVSVTLHYPQALSQINAMDHIDAQGFCCEIWRINADTGEHQTILSSGEGGGAICCEHVFDIFNSQWNVTVRSLHPWYAHASLWLCAAAGILLSAVAAAFVLNRRTLARMQRQAAQAQILELQRQLEYDRTNVLLTQISSHFFYHTLNALQALIVLKPDAAYKMAEDFSRFLRFKVDSVNAKRGLVSFREEMRSVRAYADINLVQLEGRLRIEYDVPDEDFLIPVLTLQPIVENAVVHGVKPKIGGGTVRISLVREGAFYIVTVTDDGAGFAVGERSAGRSVGIENIRTRMKQYPGCGISVESALGEGTTVQLRYPDDLSVGGNE